MVAKVVLSLMAPVKVCVFRTPSEDQPEDDAWLRLPGRRLIQGGGNNAGALANHKDLRSRSRYLGMYCWFDCELGDLIYCWISDLAASNARAK